MAGAPANVVRQLEVHAQSQLSGHVRNLRLVVRDNGIVLQGQVHTYYAKQLAQQVAMKQTSLPIRNEIEVF